MSDPRAAAVEREHGLHKELSKRQITMIGLGGALGTGLFMGSSLAIGYAGPAVLVSYLIAAFAAVAMVLSLSEMAVVHPTAGSFGTYAEMYLSPWAGFVVRWTYWFAQVIAIAGEATAVGTYMTWWFPDSPVWVWSVGFAAALVWINTRSVGNFGTIEYWLTVVKVSAIVGFIVIGAALVLGVGQPAVGLGNVTGLPGGFAPHGFGGIWMGLIVAIFSFVGIEVIAVTAGEAKDPRSAIPAALRTMALRLFLFYVLALGIIVAVVPWTASAAKTVAESPFVRVLAHVGIPYAAGLMNFVVLSAALSSMNTNLYLTSRMLFSLSRGGHAPGLLGRLGAAGTPAAAAWTSGTFILIAAALSKLTPLAYNYLFGIALFGALVVWIAILASHLRFRRHHDPATLPVRTPLFPWMQWAALALLAAILVTMGLDRTFWNVSWIVGVPWLALVSLGYLAMRRRPGAAPAADAG
jgi:L-asparagine transporter-like permease